MSTNDLITMSNLTFCIESRVLFDKLSYQFQAGCYAVVGENGVGKTTLLNMLAGVMLMPHDTIHIYGYDLNKHPVQAKSCLAYVSDKLHFYPFVTGKYFLNFIVAVRKIKDKSRLQELVKLFFVEKYLDITIEKMSLGTQKKFLIIAALIADANVLLMDEPTNALDQESKRLLVDLINEKKSHCCVILATHDREFMKRVEPVVLELKNAKFLGGVA